MRVTVLQTGARHAYAQPRFLAEHGALQRLYTDLAFGGDGMAARVIRRLPAGRTAGKLRRRVADRIPGSRIDSSRRRGGYDFIGPPWRLRPGDVAEANIFFAQYFTGANGLRQRLRPDQHIVSDVFTVPATFDVINAEVDRFPEWGERRIDAEFVTGFRAFTRTMLDESTALFCPAQSVIDGVAAIGEAYRAKCRLVPYGSAMSPPDILKPIPKRVLFAGTLTLRKGIHYLRAAADRLLKEDPTIRIVVAGGGSATTQSMLAAPNVEVVGVLSREELQRQFAIADMFVFPTLAEGSAGVVLEALANSLPIVTTRSAGVAMHDPDAAIIVAERSAEELAEAVMRIVCNRPLRAHMADAARRSADSYSLARWESSFVGALEDVCRGDAFHAAAASGPAQS